MQTAYHGRRGCHRTEGAEDDFAKGLAIVLTKLPPFTLSNHIEVQERVRTTNAPR